MSVPLNMILGYALRMYFVHSNIRVVVAWGQQWRALLQLPSINQSKKGPGQERSVVDQSQGENASRPVRRSFELV
jgi:hypothetical protein